MRQGQSVLKAGHHYVLRLSLALFAHTLPGSLLGSQSWAGLLIARNLSLVGTNYLPRLFLTAGTTVPRLSVILPRPKHHVQ